MYKRIYDSDEIVVDQHSLTGVLRVSVFEDGHWVDEHFVALPGKPEIMTLYEVGDLLRVSNQTIYNMIRDGRIKGSKVGREWRFLRSDIEAYLSVTEMEPVVHAHWVDRYGGKYANPRYECSACKIASLYKPEGDVLGATRWVQVLSDICPHCGAHMDEIRRVGYCPICDKEVESYEEGSMTRCPTCNHHIVLHEEVKK